METNWFIVLPVIVAVTALIIFLIVRNQKDKKELVKTIIEEDQIPISREPDTEVDPAEEKV